MISAATALKDWIRALQAIQLMQNAPETTLPGLLDELAETHADRPALLDTSTTLSYRSLAAQANRTARWAIAQGFAPGDVVALMLPNCPDYVATWLGLTRAGCTVALINTNLTGDSLQHSLNTAAPKCLLTESTLPELAALSEARLTPAECRLPRPQDRALLIYTSGTTGQPKAANLTHARILEWSLWFAGMMNAQPADRLYDCLPMYHSVGGVVAIGAMLVRGGSVLIRRQFSASRFWDDVVDGGCTIFQYIGELCRYLTASPPHPKERDHQLRLACGNGLQGDVWTQFQQRFAIPRILEFYAATEGSVSLYNCEGKPGAIGRVPAVLANRFPVALIRIDSQTETPHRDATGLCIACDPNEVGEAIGLILDQPNAPARQFDGYTDPAASARKVLTDVFTHGDRWFRTGDLMRRDDAGFFYFIDRMGDSFRWKGENVSTTQVATVLRALPGVTDAVVFGVSVPGHEGRAGMAAITTNENFNLAALPAHLSAHLPHYAQPLFVRCCQTLEITGTFKLTKGKLAAEGYTNSTDPVWFNDRGTNQFIPWHPDLLTANRRL
jgi:fatty-acyl-CoA synthase